MSDTPSSSDTARANPAYVEATDCPICPMIATDRDDALAEVRWYSEAFQCHVDEIDRLRLEVQRLHKLNGWSKQKGWWCSCGAPLWSRFSGYVDDDGVDIKPWSPEGRAKVLPVYNEHVRRAMFGVPK